MKSNKYDHHIMKFSIPLIFRWSTNR